MPIFIWGCNSFAARQTSANVPWFVERKQMIRDHAVAASHYPSPGLSPKGRGVATVSSRIDAMSFVATDVRRWWLAACVAKAPSSRRGLPQPPRRLWVGEVLRPNKLSPNNDVSLVSELFPLPSDWRGEDKGEGCVPRPQIA